MSRARDVPKVDFGELRQRDLGTSARRPACLGFSGWSSNITLQEGRAGQTQPISRGWTGGREAGRRKMIRQPGAKSPRYLASVDRERHLTCSAAASDADHNLSMGGFRVDSSIRHLACGFAPAHSLGAVDLLAERDPPCRDRRDLRSNAFFVQPEDYHPRALNPTHLRNPAS